MFLEIGLIADRESFQSVFKIKQLRNSHDCFIIRKKLVYLLNRKRTEKEVKNSFFLAGSVL